MPWHPSSLPQQQPGVCHTQCAAIDPRAEDVSPMTARLVVLADDLHHAVAQRCMAVPLRVHLDCVEGHVQPQRLPVQELRQGTGQGLAG